MNPHARRLITAAGTLALGLASLAGCAPTVTASCSAAFDQASQDIETLYATHPFYGAPYDAIYEDGDVTDEEQLELNAMMADEESKYNAAVEPLYSACSGVEDFYQGAYDQGDSADWSVHGTPAISDEDLKTYFLDAYCGKRTETNACSDYVPSS